MPTASEWVNRMRSQLAVTEPNLDTSVGTVSRKILDAVGEALSEASVDNYLIEYQYDIDAKSGAELDRFVELFGFTRLAARRATGIVTVSLAAARPSNFVLPTGAQFSTLDNPSVQFVSIVPAVILAGETSVDVPVQAVDGGARGNVPAYSITSVLASQSAGVSIRNIQATTGGQDAESDGQLRLRFRRTVFRKMAGTADSFLSVALEDPDVTHANVIGSEKVRREQIALTATEDSEAFVHGESTLAGAVYIYPDSAVFGPFIDDGDIRVEGSDYDFVVVQGTESSEASAGIKSLSGGTEGEPRVPDGIYELEYAYTPQASRNKPYLGVTNRVDLWVKGQRVREASETVLYPAPIPENVSSTFDSATTVGPDVSDFVRVDESQPDVGNVFVPLSFGPIVTVPSSINIIAPDGSSTTTYYSDDTESEQRFWVVHEEAPFGWSPRSRFGLEITAGENAETPFEDPPDGSLIQLEYNYNDVPRTIERNIQDWRLITSDVRAHQARLWYLTMNFVVLPNQRFTGTELQYEIGLVVNDYINRLGFTETIQASDILAAAHSANGVDAVRWANSDDNATNFAIQRYVRSVTSTSETTGDPERQFATELAQVFCNPPADDEDPETKRVTDIFMDDATLAVYNGCRVILRAENNFGSA